MVRLVQYEADQGAWRTWHMPTQARARDQRPGGVRTRSRRQLSRHRTRTDRVVRVRKRSCAMRASAQTRDADAAREMTAPIREQLASGRLRPARMAAACNQFRVAVAKPEKLPPVRPFCLRSQAGTSQRDRRRGTAVAWRRVAPYGVAALAQPRCGAARASDRTGGLDRLFFSAVCGRVAERAVV